MADSFEVVLALRHDLGGIIGSPQLIALHTDSESLLRVITRETTTTEKNLMIVV